LLTLTLRFTLLTLRLTLAVLTLRWLLLTFRLTFHTPADLTIALTVGKRQKVDVDEWNRYGYHDNYVYNEGQISLDAFDAKTKRAVWHGQITDTINPKRPDPARLQAALDKLIEQFPGH
jgi:hypothetical protein